MYPARTQQPRGELTDREFLSADEGVKFLLGGGTILDVRSPTEFRQGALPGTVSAPLMSDEERTKVGTVYRLEGGGAAVCLGHLLVCGDVRRERISRWRTVYHEASSSEIGSPRCVVMCARGGLRSEIAQAWLNESLTSANLPGCPRVSGGYKAVRNAILRDLPVVARSLHPLVLCGRTGSGKSELLRSEVLMRRSLDLEKRANHCGSGFGAIYGTQPAQSTFENGVALDLFSLARQGGSYVVEDESIHIGSNRVPKELFDAMTNGERIVIERSLEERIGIIRTMYVERFDGMETRSSASSSERPSELESFLRASLARVSERLGGARSAECRKLLDRALAAHRQGSMALHAEWITFLLREYYDPMYDRGLAKHQGAIAFRGTASEVVAYLEDRLQRSARAEPQNPLGERFDPSATP